MAAGRQGRRRSRPIAVGVPDSRIAGPQTLSPATSISPPSSPSHAPMAPPTRIRPLWTSSQQLRPRPHHRDRRTTTKPHFRTTRQPPHYNPTNTRRHLHHHHHDTEPTQNRLKRVVFGAM